ncbi:MAG: HNH endonuclease, partial [Aeromicrobium sp.]
MDSGVTIERLREAARALKAGDSRTKLRAIQAAQDALDAAKAAELAVLQESKDYELDGASSVTTWARNELRLDAKASKALVRAAST